MRPDVRMVVEAAREAARVARQESAQARRWATVQAGGNPALVLVDGDDDNIEAQPTVGSVTSDDRVRVEWSDSGAVLIVGIR